MKKLISMLLVLCMVLTLSPAVFAAEGTAGGDADVNETDYFEDQWHDPDVDLKTVQPFEIDTEAIDAEIEAFYALFESEETEEADVEAAFEKFIDYYEEAVTNYQLYYYRYSANTADSASYTLAMENYELGNIYWDELLQAARKVLNSDYAAFLEKQLTDEDIEFLKSYEDMTEEELALSNELAALEEDYYNAYYYGDPEFEYEGNTWTYDGIVSAYEAGEIDDETYAALYALYVDAFWADVGAVYADLQDVCQRTAEYYGYDNYADYAYENIYTRDYTPEEIQAYCDAVKKYIAPLGAKLEALAGMVGYADEDSFYNVYLGDFTTDETLDAIEPYIGKISSEMLEAWQYMREHNLIDIAASDTKATGNAFTYSLLHYRAPYMIAGPQIWIGDFSTIIHEFGHYNDNYWHEHDWNSAESNTDVAEVHSQANELLFSQYYEDFFGDTEYGTDIAMNNLMDSITVWGLLCGSLVGELELYIHSDAKPTFDEINAKFDELVKEYGLTETFGEDSKWWVEIQHLVSQPFYYISYSVSAAGAFAFWLDAQTSGYDKAYSDYLKFVALDPALGFSEMFEEMKMESPLSPEYIEDLAAKLDEALKINERGEFAQLVLERAQELTDVTYNRPERGIDYDAIWTMVDEGYMQGVGGNLFKPNDDATRATTVTVLWNIVGNEEVSSDTSLTDVAGKWYEAPVTWAVSNKIITGVPTEKGMAFNGDESVTRESIAAIFYRYAAANGLDTSVSAQLNVADASSIQSWAVYPVTWAVEKGLLTVGTDNTVDPAGDVSRSDLAAMAVAYLEFASGGNAAE